MSIYYYINNESTSNESINKYEDYFYQYINQTPTLENALNEMFISNGVTEQNLNALINEICLKVKNHLADKYHDEIKNIYPNINYEDERIISSYTCELSCAEFSPYKILNKNLVSKNRFIGITKISKYLYIFLKSLRKLKRFYPDKKKIFI